MMVHAGEPNLTANDRFKRRWSKMFPMSVVAATVLHFGVFTLFPHMRAAPPAAVAGTLESVELPPQVEVPPPPEQIARPATPKIAAVEVSEEITIAPTTFDSNPVRNLAPPSAEKEAEGDRPPFIPYTVAPRLKNKEQVLAQLQKQYPRNLRTAGVGGTVLLWIYVDERGKVQDARVAESSGYLALDRAAQEVARTMLFTPAINRDKVTAVWLSQPVDFSVTG
ncbi:MAG: energy transducer TonB [Gemmatimonadota bacterium]